MSVNSVDELKYPVKERLQQEQLFYVNPYRRKKTTRVADYI